MESALAMLAAVALMTRFADPLLANPIGAMTVPTRNLDECHVYPSESGLRKPLDSDNVKFERQEGLQRLFMFFDIFEKVEYRLSEFGEVLIEIVRGHLLAQKPP